MTEQSKLYIDKLRHWLVDGDRYVLSFPTPPEATRVRFWGELPRPNDDPIAAYKELTERLRNPTPQNVSLEAIMGTIDHSLLEPTLTKDALVKGYETAKKYNVASVCINSDNIANAFQVLKGTGIAVGSVISFPFGRDATDVKVKATIEALRNGATEIDMPINISQMISENYESVYDDLKAVWEVVYSRGGIFKPIARVDDLQTAWKGKAQYEQGKDNPLIIQYCGFVNRLQKEVGGEYHQLMVKTSTGFDFKEKMGYEGATNEVLGIFARECPFEGPVGRKAAGKVRDAQRFLYIMREFGVVRIGCTKTEEVAKELLEMGYMSHYHSK